MMFKSAAVTALLLQVANVACFTPNARISSTPFSNYDYNYDNYDTELDGYLDQLAPEAPAKFTSYMPKMTTNPKKSSVVSYLDAVGGAAAAPAPVAAAPVAAAPAAVAAPVASSVASPAASNTYEYTNTFSHTNEETQQTHTHTHHHLHTYTYSYEYDSVTIEDDQKVDVEVTVSGGAASYKAPAAPAKSYAPAKKYAESTGQAGGVATGGYLTNLRTNVMSSGGGNSLQNAASYLPVTGKPCTGGMALGNSYLNAIPVTAAPCTGYNSLSNFASMMNAAIPLQTSDYAAVAPAAPAAPVAAAKPAVPAPSAGGDYLSALGGGGSSLKPSSYAPGGGAKKPVSGKTLGNSYLNF